ncbi:MAG: T9SS type A sorting domain-containing protein [Chitinophagaceae bacterium]|nr:T9SS type A sorting domain-containing protein [Chitinophagaceae bacterium]
MVAFGRELWKSDGTWAGTVLVKDIYPGPIGGTKRYFTNVNGTLYFSADDGVNGEELWKSDGTSAGTIMVKDILPGEIGSSPQNLTNVNGVLYFSATDGINGQELWKSDGTEAGTVLVKDINPGGIGSAPNTLTNLNGVLHFAAADAANGWELWKSDGTTLGTVLVKDIFPGINSSNPVSLTVVNNTLFFTANNGTTGQEVWKTDGTEAGTVIVQDITVQGASNPNSYTLVGSKLFAAITDDVHGEELWVAQTVTVLPLTLLEFNGRLVNNDGLLNWKTTDEQSTVSFDIERSTDGRSYISVGNVLAANVTGIHHYHYKDDNVTALGVSKVYYRLKQKDIDERYSYSGIVVLSIDNSRSNVLLYPNPVSSKANVTITLTKPEKIQARIIDNTGRIVKLQQFNLSAGSNSIAIDLGQISKGMYYLELKGENINERKPFVKQ